MGCSRQESGSGLPYPPPGESCPPKNRTQVSGIGRRILYPLSSVGSPTLGDEKFLSPAETEAEKTGYMKTMTRNRQNDGDRQQTGGSQRLQEQEMAGVGGGDDCESLLCGGQKYSGTSQTGGPRNSVNMQKASGRFPGKQFLLRYISVTAIFKKLRRDTDFCGGPGVKTTCFQRRECRFNPGSGNYDPTSHTAWPKSKKQNKVVCFFFF